MIEIASRFRLRRMPVVSGEASRGHSRPPRREARLGMLPAAAALCLALASPAIATPIDFVLNPAVTTGLTGLGISGTFTFDPTTVALSNLDLTVTGGGILEAAGTYTMAVSATASSIEFDNTTLGTTITLGFTDDLGTTNPDPVNSINVSGGITSGSGGVTGGAASEVAAVTAPEPSALSTLVLALVLLGGATRLRNRRA